MDGPYRTGAAFYLKSIYTFFSHSEQVNEENMLYNSDEYGNAAKKFFEEQWTFCPQQKLADIQIGWYDHTKRTNKIAHQRLRDNSY